MSKREPSKPVKERLKQFERDGTEATALSLSSASPPSHAQGTSGQAEGKNKEQSAARQRRNDGRNKSSPTHTRDKSAGHTGPQYSRTNNQDSFAMSDLPTSPVSLTSPITTQAVYSSLSTVPANRTTNNSSHKPRTSPQPSLDTCTTDSLGERDPQPPKTQRPNEMYVPSNRNPKRPEPGDDGKAKVKLPLLPMRADHSAFMMKHDSDYNKSPLSPTASQSPQCVPLYHDTFFHSPQCSGDFHHSGISQCGEDEMKKPQQCASMEVATRLLASDHISMPIDARMGFSKTSEASREILRRYSKVSSTDSDCTDKMIGLESSVPIGLIAGSMTPTDSLVYKLRDQIDRLEKKLEARENEIQILTEVAETSVDIRKKTTTNVDPLDEPGDDSMPSFGGLSSGEDLLAGGGDKMVGLRTSMKTDDKGVPQVKGRRPSRQEQDLIKKSISLESQLVLKQTEIDCLNDQNVRKQKTINSLQATVQKSEGIYRRGYSNTDIDGYLDKIVELTTQLTDIEEQERKQRLKNVELELQVSKSKTVTKFAKQLSTEREQLKSEVKQLKAALEEEQTRQPLPVDSIPAASLTDDRLHLRVMTEEAVKVPELEREVANLKKNLKHAESFEEVAKQYSDQLLEKVTELSNREEEIRKLTDELQHHQENQAADISDHTAVTESEEYQILLQDVMAKDEQLRQLQNVAAHRQKLQMDLELQATELKMKTEQADEKTTELEAKKTELAEKAEELRTIQAQFELSEKLNKKLREHVLAKTSPVPVPGTELKTEHPQQRGKQIISGDAERRFSIACKTIDELNGKIVEMESTIQELSLGNGSMAAEMQNGQSQIDKLVTDRQNVLDHSKKQSQTIADLKSQLKALQESHQNSEQIEAYRKEKSELESQLNWLKSQNAQLKQELSDMKRLGGDTSAVVQALQEESQAMHADLDRIRAERNELRQRTGRMEELDKKYNHSQQKIISQQALLENQHKELNDLRLAMPHLKEAVQKHQTELIHISKQRDEAKSELDVSKQTMQIYVDDFRSERKDREQAHSKMTEMETECTKKLESMTNELQTKARELEVAVKAHYELKARYDAEVTQLKGDLREKNDQIYQYGRRAQTLEEDIQAKTAQVKQYKKQVDQFREQMEAGKEQAEILKARVESTVTQTDRLEREKKKLTYDNQQLNGHLRQMEATQSQRPGDRQLQEQLDKCVQTIDDLTMKNTMLLSELEELKKRGVVSTQAPPTRSSESNAARQMPGNRPLLPNQAAMRPPTHPPQQLLVPHPQQAPHPQRLDPQWKAQSVDDSYYHRGQRLGNDGRPAHTGYVDQSHLSMGEPHRHHRTADLGRLPHPPQQQSPAYPQGRNLPPPSSNADSQLVGTGGTTRGPYGYPTYSNMPLSSGFGQQGPTSLPPSIGSPTHPTYGQGYGRPDVSGAYQQTDVIERDSPPSSYQPPSTSASQQSNARNQFANKHPGMSHSTDSYHNQPAGGQYRPHTGKPIPTPRIQGGSETSGRRPPAHYGTGQQQLHQVPSSGLPPTTNAQHRVQSSQVPHPQQESRGAAAVRSPLPPQMRAQSQNFSYRPPAPQQSAGRRHAPETNSREEVSTSSDYSTSNQLDKNIDKEIRQEALRVARQGSGEDSQPADGDTIPPDPNLICPRCGRQFRLGEIQKFKRHADNCSR